MTQAAIVEQQPWFAARGRWQRLGLAMIAGVLMTGGHPPVFLPWLLFLAVPLVVLLVSAAPTARAAAWIGWGAGFGYFATGLHWIGHAFVVDAERFAWLMPLGVVALPAGLALFWALAFWATRRLVRGDPISVAFMLAALWSVVEFARSHVLTGLPWALPGYVWVDTPAMQVAAWVGPYGITLLTLLLTGLTGVAIQARRPIIAALAIAAGVVIWFAGAARIPAEIAYAEDAPVIRIVQPNAAQAVKWQPGFRAHFYRRALSATGAPPDPELGPAAIVIWPETAAYTVPTSEPSEVARIAERAGGAVVLAGALFGEVTPNGDRWTNALVTILPDGRLGPRYDKHHLVPFGEYLPFEETLTALGLSQFAIRGGFARGPGPQTLVVPGIPSFSPLICYEAIFPHEIVGETRPDWLVQPTNDAWFGGFAGPQQHYAQARIRAIEQGLPMVRAANTGISAIVSPHGQEVISIGLGLDGYADERLPAPLEPTVYSRFGDALFFFLFAVIAALALVRRDNGIN